MRAAHSAAVFGSLALIAAQPALAADGAGGSAGPQFEIMGPATCAQWPKSGAITSAAKAVPLNWTLGFLSGWAALGKLQLLDVIDAEDVAKWMGDYCAANPTVTLPLAARELERQLEAKLPAPPPPPQPPPLAAAPAPAPAPVEARPAAPAAKAPATPARRRPAPRR